MNHAISNLEVDRLASRAKLIASDRTLSKRTGNDLGTVLSIVESIKSYPKFAKLVEYSLDCLSNVIESSEVVEDILQAGILESLSHVMKSHPFNERLQRSLNRLVETVVKGTDKSCVTIVNDGVVNLLIHSLEKHQDPSTHQSTISLIQTIGEKSEEAVSAFVQSGGLRSIRNVMDDNLEDPQILNCGFNLLNQKQILMNETAVEETKNLNILELATDGIKMHYQNEQCLESLAKFIRASAETGDKGSSKHFFEHMKKSNVKVAINRAMEFNPNAHWVVAEGSALLSIIQSKEDVLDAISVLSRPDIQACESTVNLACDKPALQGKTSLKTLLDNEATDGGEEKYDLEEDAADEFREIQVTSKFIEKVDAVVKIANLCIVQENAKLVVEHNGVDLLFGALKSSLEHDSQHHSRIAETSIRAITRLCHSEKSVLFEFPKDDHIGILKAVQLHFKKFPGVQSEMLQLLHVLSSTDLTSGSFSKVFSLQGVLEVIEIHRESHKIVHEGISLLNHLSSLAETKNVVAQKSVYQAVSLVFSSYERDQRIISESLSLCNVLISDPKTLVEFPDSLLLQVVKILEQNINDSSIVHSTVSFLSKAQFQTTHYRNKIKSYGIVKLFASIHDIYGNDSDIALVTRNLLHDIIGGQDPKEMHSQIKSLVQDFKQDTLKDFKSAVDTYLPLIQQKISSLQEISTANEFDQADTIILLESACMLVKAVLPILSMPEFLDHLSILEIALDVISQLLQASRPEILDGRESCFSPEEYMLIFNAVLGKDMTERKAEILINLSVFCLGSGESFITALPIHRITEDLISLAKAFHLNDRILSGLCSTLVCILEANPDLKSATSLAQETNLVVEAVFANVNDYDRMLDSVLLIRLLVEDIECCLGLHSSGAISAISKVMGRYSEDVEIMELCFSVLVEMSRYEIVLDSFLEIKLIPLFVSVFQTHSKTLSVAHSGLAVLDALSNHSASFVELCRLDSLLPLLENLLDLHSSDSTILESGSQIINKLLEWLGRDASTSAETIDSSKDLFLQLNRCVELNSGTEIIQKIGHDCVISEKNVHEFLESGGISLLAKAAKFARLESLDLLLRIILSASYESLSAWFKNELFPVDLMTECDAESSIHLLDRDFLIRLLEATALISRFKAVRRHFLSKGLVPRLFLLVFHQHQSSNFDEEILAALLKCLAKFTREKDIEVLFLEYDSLLSIENLVRFASLHSSKQRISRHWASLLSALSDSESLIPRLLSANVIRVAGESLSNFPDDARITDPICSLFVNLSFEYESGPATLMTYPTLLTTLFRFGRYGEAPLMDDFVTNLATLVANLCLHDKQSKNALPSLGASRTLVNISLRSGLSISPLLSTFKALGNLAYFPENVPGLVDLGIAQALVAGLVDHLDNLELVEVAIDVLSNLAADSSSQVREVLVIQGVIQALIEAALKFPGNPRILLATFRSLSSLGTDDVDHAALIIQQRGIHVIANTLTRFPKDEALIGRASTLLLVLSRHEILLLRASKTPKLASAITRLFSGVIRLKSCASWTLDLVKSLAHLASSSNAASKLASRDLLAALAQLCHTFPNSAALFRACLQSLTRLAVSDDLCVFLTGSFLEFLLKQINSRFGDPEQLEHLLALLAALCAFDSAALLVLDAGAAAPLLQTLSLLRRPQAAGAVLAAVLSVERLAFTGERAREELRRGRALELLRAAHEAFSGDRVLGLACVRAEDAVLGRRTRGMLEETVDAVRQRMRDPVKRAKMTAALRNSMLAGARVSRWGAVGGPTGKHLFMSADLSVVCLRDAKKADGKKVVQIPMSAVQAVRVGRASPQLRRKTALGKWLVDEDRAFVIVAKNASISLECDSEKIRDDWVAGIRILIRSLKSRSPW